MTARQFLLSESSYCRQRAAGCADRYIAEELRRLAEQFERTAAAEDTHARQNLPQCPAKPGIKGFPPASGTGYNQAR
jgi:hypothetical protein